MIRVYIFLLGGAFMDADSGSKRNFSQLNQNAPELGIN